MPGIGGSRCAVHQIIAIVSDGGHIGKPVNPQTVENHGCREVRMVIPDFAGELPMTVEIAVIAWSAKSAARSGVLRGPTRGRCRRVDRDAVEDVLAE